MKKTWNLILALVFSLLSSSLFAQKNVVWKKVASRKKAEKYLSGAKEIKGKHALKVFKGSIIKKYKIAEDDPYFNVGDSEERGSVTGSTNQHYIVALRRMDVSDPKAFRNGEYEEASKEPEEESDSPHRKFRCYEYTIGNVDEGTSDYKKESQCFLIGSNGYVSGEDPDVHDHDNDHSEVKTNTLGKGCLKIAQCRPRGLKVRQKSSGRYSMKEDDKQSFLGRLFKGNKDKKRAKQSSVYHQKDNKMIIESCVGGCSKGYRLVKEIYALDGEEAPIRREISSYCQMIATERYDLTAQDTVDSHPYTDVKSSDMPRIEGYHTESENSASQHFIYVNKCVKEESEDEDRRGTSGRKKRRSKKRSSEKKSSKKTSRKPGVDSEVKLADNLVNNGLMINNIQLANGARGSVLNNGGPNGSGWFAGGGGVSLVPGYATMYPTIGASGSFPSVIVINPGGYPTGAVQGLPIMPGNMNFNGNVMSRGVFMNNNGNIVYNENGGPEREVDVRIQKEKNTVDPYHDPLCLDVELTPAKVECLLTTEKSEVHDIGKSLKELYQKLCVEVSQEEQERYQQSLQLACAGEFTESMVDSLAAKKYLESGGNIRELTRAIKEKSILVTGVKIRNENFNGEQANCFDSTQMLLDSENSDESLGAIEHDFISLDPEDYKNKETELTPSELKSMGIFYESLNRMIERRVGDVFKGFKKGQINEGNIDELLKDKILKANYSGLYSLAGKNSKELAMERHKVNSEKLNNKIKNEIKTGLISLGYAKVKNEKHLDELFDRIVEINSTEPKQVGPVPISPNLEEIKKEIESSNYACTDDNALDLYKCSIVQGCVNVVLDKSIVLPDHLAHCDEIEGLEHTDKAFTKWYEGNEGISAHNKKPNKMKEQSFNFYIGNAKNEPVIEDDERVVEIKCENIINDGKKESRMQVYEVVTRDNGTETKLVIDNDCVQEQLRHNKDAYGELSRKLRGARSTASE